MVLEEKEAEMAPQVPEYKIISSDSRDNMEKLTNKMFAEGWQPGGQLIITNDGSFYHEMIKFPLPANVDESVQRAEVDFDTKKSEMDTYVKDLLDINKITLTYQNGKLFTVYDTKISEGISPTQVVHLIKESKHCPIDLDEGRVIKAIEGLL